MRAEVVVPGGPLEATTAFFVELGFAVESVFPAEDPRVIVLLGSGVRLRLDRGFDGAPGKLRIVADRRPETLRAPNGTVVELVAASATPRLPALAPAFSLVRGGSWTAGRAGMQYRDLIPDRQGGRFIASHIRIPDGGPVPDYVHYHRICFQMIYCYRGWVRVVYEDQGPAFVMRPGDCVLQPPQIRHRVLESSPGLEVIEVSCPAEHETMADAELELPNGTRDRSYGGQRFVLHRGGDSVQTEIDAATGGLAAVQVTVPDGAAHSHAAELLFNFVLDGEGTLTTDRARPLASGDAFVIPAGAQFRIDGAPRLLEVKVAAVGPAPARG